MIANQPDLTHKKYPGKKPKKPKKNQSHLSLVYKG